MEADKTRQLSVLLACRSRADLTRLGGVDSPTFPFITLACKHNRADLLKLLLEDDTSCWCSVQYEGHGAAYFAIRSSNVELLRTLLGSVTPELSERLVSESYEELLLNNVLLSEEMHLFVQYTLVDLRFFSKDVSALPATSSANNNIQERIRLLVDHIVQINTNEEVDSHFLYTAKFIAQNIHILKQQLKSSYDILPWEEMEFCLVSFVSAHIRRQELNIFYLSILRKDRLLKELNKFASDLQVEVHIGSIDIRKRVRLRREDIAAAIAIRYPDLYADYKEVRDISSLHIMKKYLDAALLADSETTHGQLIIKRALQVTGEHLKNTLDSPKLSRTVSDRLLISAPNETIIVLKNLRNAFSHQHQSDDSVFFSKIQNDIKKFASVITDVLHFSKVDIIKCTLTRLTNSESVEEIQEIANVFQHAHEIVDVQGINMVTEERQKIESFITSIEVQTPEEKILLAEIKDAVDKTKSQHHITTNDFSILKAISYISSVYNSHSTKTVQNMIIDMKHAANRILKKFPTKKNPKDFEKYMSKLGSLLSQFYDIVSKRIKPEIAIEINFAIARINYTRSIDKDINCIDDYRRNIFSNMQEKFERMFTKISNEIIGLELDMKLMELKKIIGTNSYKLYEHLLLLYKDEITNRFALEVLVMDILNLLESSHCVANNLLYLDGDMPLLSGRCLRNHLAHGYALVDILPTDVWSAVLLNARKLSESKDRLLNNKMGNILKHNIEQLRRRYERGLSILDKQEEMWKSLLDGNFENFVSGIAEGADICSRKKDLSSTLHFAARGPNIEIIKFLTKQEMISAEAKDVNGQTALHIAAAFGRDVTVIYLVEEMRNAINQVNGAGKTPLHLASQNGHNETVATLLLLEAKTTIKDSDGYFPLHYAVLNNYLDVVKTLLEKCATVEENTDCDGYTSLHTAAENGHVEMVQYLLLKEADVNAKTKQGIIPLHLAARNGHLEVVKDLLEKEADVNLKDSEGRSSLYFAVENSHKEIVKILLEKRACFYIGNVRANKITVFHRAVSKGDAHIVELLLKYKANVNAKAHDGLTPLILAAAGGHAEIVKLLLRNKALADSRDVKGLTALHYAAQHGHSSVVKALIEMGIGIYTHRRTSKVTPLHLAAGAGHLQVVHILLAAGVNVHSVTDQGSTALHYSAKNGHKAISVVLIKKGVKVKNSGNFTPLHAAAIKSCNEKTIRILLQNGANVNERGERCLTALHIAAFAGDGPMVEALLREKADVDAKANGGTTALHLAANGNHKAVVKILLKYGADVNHMDATGSSALCFAAENNKKGLLDILIAKGADVNVGGGKLLLSAIAARHRHVFNALSRNIEHLNEPNLLYAAAVSGDASVARALIIKGIKVADCVQDPSPLFIAIKYGHTEFVQVLLEEKDNVYPTDPNFTPLHYAVKKNKPDIVERLLKLSCNFSDSKNWTPIELAVAKGQLKNTSILLQQKGVIKKRGNDNRTLLHIAAEAGNLEIVTLLVGRGANINASDRLGFKPIHIAAREGHNHILAFFLELPGISIDTRGHNGCSLMHCAVAGGQLAVAQYLIDKHVDINSTDINGSMPIHCSAELGHTEMVKLLLHNGAVYDAKNKLGRSPLELSNNRDIKKVLKSIGKLFKAVKRNNTLMIDTLAKDLAKYLNVRNSDNATLVHIASGKGFQEVCDILLESKANPNAVGKGGNAALHYASKHCHPAIVVSLLKKGAVHNLMTDNTDTPLDFATQKDIKSLLQIVALCFEKVKKGDAEVVTDITKIRDVEIKKAVMRTCDTDGNTLLVAAMKYGFPNIDELKQVSQTYVPHILIAVETLFMCKSFTEALDVLKPLLKERIELLGEGNPEIVDIQYKIALALYNESKYFEAMIMLEDIYRKRVEALGPKHLDSLETRSRMGLLLHKLGRNEEAWDILQEVMSMQQEELGEGHEKLMPAKTSAGFVLLALGKYEEALHLHTQVYKIHKTIYGAQPSDKLQLEAMHLQSNIAVVLHVQGKYHETFALYQTIYKTRKTILGSNHPVTLKARHSMANVLKSQNKHDEAIQVYQEILHIQEEVLELNHTDTVETKGFMTHLRLKQKEHQDAMKVRKEWWEARNTFLNFSPNYPKYTEWYKDVDDFKYLKSICTYC